MSLFATPVTCAVIARTRHRMMQAEILEAAKQGAKFIELRLDFLSKARWLDADDLFYLGFHFVEGTGSEKEFGGQILNLLLERFPRSKLAKDAKNKLRRQGVK